MPANTTPIYEATPQVRTATLRVTNSSRDGSGIVYSGFFSDINGSRLDRITTTTVSNVNPGSPSNACLIRIFITDTNGLNPRIYREHYVGSTSLSSTLITSQTVFNIPGGLLLMPGQIVQCTATNLTYPITVTFEGVDYAAPINGPLYKRTITVVKDFVGLNTTDLTNFATLVSINADDIKHISNGGKVQNTNGYDIQFFSDSAFTNKLNWEIDTYNSTTGELMAWVNIPTVTYNTYTKIYMSYGDSSITTFQGGANGSVWDSNYKVVYHMGVNGTLDLTDSTSNGNNGVNYGGVTSVSGYFSNSGGAAGFNTNRYIETNYVLSPTAFTMSFWGISNATGATNTVMGNTNYTGDPNNVYSGADVIWGSSPGFIYSRIRKTGTSYDIQLNTAAVVANKWAYIALTFDTTNGGRLYYNDTVRQLSYTGTSTNTLALTSLLTTRIGRTNGSVATSFTGTVDEVRISDVARSQFQIATEYYNGMWPGNFYNPGIVGFLNYSSEY